MKLIKQQIVALLPKRPVDAHKGTFGKVLTFAGSENFPGAAYLACAATLRAGAGLVTLVTPQTVKIIISQKLPEITFLSYDEALDQVSKYDVLLIGPGLGQKATAIKLVETLLKKKLQKAIIDADGLNILSQIKNWWDELPVEIILTPHPGEMSKLTGLSTEEIQSNRLNIVQNYAKKWNKIIVLKGANTVIASPAGDSAVSPFANPVLATAGTGDVLAGVITGMTAQGLTAFDAACVGVYLHGLAGEVLKEKIGNSGALASDLLFLIPQMIKELI